MFGIDRMTTWIVTATPQWLERLARISRTTNAAGWWWAHWASWHLNTGQNLRWENVGRFQKGNNSRKQQTNVGKLTDFPSFVQACYGRSDAESVERVKALYDTLEMPIRYHQHEEESYRRLQKLIQLHAKNLPHAVFLNFAKKIYKRNK